MKLTIINKVTWKHIYLVLLDERYNVINKIELLFDNKEAKQDIDLNQVKYCYFTNGKRKTDIIILSTNLSVLTLIYNKKTKLYKCDLSIENKTKYGKVETYILKDKKNLFYRNDNQKVINVYVPSNYDENKQYKVLIMFDSQNIYDIKKVGKYTTKNDPYGGWQVETSLENIDLDYIVVGIENADEYREIELTFNKYSNELKRALFEKQIDCHLDNLDDFINETLLPFISTRYNVITDNMGICGSSCGGLASLYVGLKNTNKYGFIFTFTPAIGMCNDENLKLLFESLSIKSKTKLPYIFFFQGNTGELEQMLYNSNKNLIDILLSYGYNQELIDSYIEENANHNEDPWRYAFNYAINKIKEKKI